MQPAAGPRGPTASARLRPQLSAWLWCQPATAAAAAAATSDVNLAMAALCCRKKREAELLRPDPARAWPLVCSEPDSLLVAGGRSGHALHLEGTAEPQVRASSGASHQLRGPGGAGNIRATKSTVQEAWMYMHRDLSMQAGLPYCAQDGCQPLTTVRHAKSARPCVYTCMLSAGPLSARISIWLPLATASSSAGRPRGAAHAIADTASDDLPTAPT